MLFRSNPMPYKKHIIVCVNEKESGKCCGPSGGIDIRNSLKSYVKENNLTHVVRVSQAKCLGRCGNGPNVMIYPDNIWLEDVGSSDCDRIIQDHIKCFM